jgi:hypothetical protein
MDAAQKIPVVTSRVAVSILARRAARKAHCGLIFGILNASGAIVALYGDTDKGDHGYMEPYRRHFGKQRFPRNVVMEIGVGG